MTQHVVEAPDGRHLAVRDAGDPDAPALVAHHGTPAAGRFFGPELASAEQHGVRLIAYDRPGYGGSTPQRGRRVADAAADVAAIVDALGVERFATYGWSGGGPHALACAALLPDRCAAVCTIAGAGPFDAPDLDWLAGMGEGNIAEFGAAQLGREALTEYCRTDAAGIMAASAEELADAMRPHLSDVDRAALTGELAVHLAEVFHAALEPGVEGWVDDDLAFINAWGFDPAAISVPLLVLQGEHDFMVPTDHGRWLLSHLPAEGGVRPGEGHLTLFADRIGEIHAWLVSQAALTSAPGRPA
jgi:pimeloyl-ACP methyl ester carboxylesterase